MQFKIYAKQSFVVIVQLKIPEKKDLKSRLNY